MIAFTMNEISPSARSLQRDDGQMLAFGMEANFERKFRTGTATNEGPRSGTRRTTWPPVASFVSWPTIGGKRLEIHLIGRFSTEPSVWTALVVPLNGIEKLLKKLFASVGDERHQREQAFHR